MIVDVENKIKINPSLKHLHGKKRKMNLRLSGRGPQRYTPKHAAESQRLGPRYHVKACKITNNIGINSCCPSLPNPRREKGQRFQNWNLVRAKSIGQLKCSENRSENVLRMLENSTDALTPDPSRRHCYLQSVYVGVAVEPRLAHNDEGLPGRTAGRTTADWRAGLLLLLVSRSFGPRCATSRHAR